MKRINQFDVDVAINIASRLNIKTVSPVMFIKQLFEVARGSEKARIGQLCAGNVMVVRYYTYAYYTHTWRLNFGMNRK